MKKILFLALTALFCTAATAQLRVTGTVTSSEDGTPVSFATVFVKSNNNLITSTDIDGKFVLPNVPGDAVLVVTFIGFTAQEVPVNGRTVVNVVISPDALALEEVMVVAYGTAKRSTYTGAASAVRADAIKDIPNATFQNSLSGKVSGLQVTTPSGQAGASYSFRVRGTGSMNATNEPLYVIDGVPVITDNMGQLGQGELNKLGNNPMSSLNPSDIESITVLKDAAASALYGSRAANGVILIQTKRGTQGKPKVEFKASFGFSPSFATDNYEKATTEQAIEMEYELFFLERKWLGYNDMVANNRSIAQLNTRFNPHGYWFYLPIGSNTENAGKLFSKMVITDHPIAMSSTNAGESNGMATGLSSGRLGKYFDWEKALFRTASYQTYDISVSGASETTSYYTSLSYTQDKGRYVMNDFTRISGRLNLTQKLGKFAEISSNASVSKNMQQGFNDYSNVRTNVFMQERNLLWGLYYPTNYVDDSPWLARYGSLAWNDIAHRHNWNNYANTLRVTAVEALTVYIMEGLRFKTTLSFDNNQSLEHLFYNSIHPVSIGEDWDGSVDEYSSNATKIVSSSILDFSKTFRDKHTLSLLAGFEVEQNRSDYQRASGTKLPTSTLEQVATAGEPDAMAYWWAHNMMSVLSRAEYNFNNKYYVSASYRRDGSSKLGENTRWGDFWSVAGSWRITSEEFMKGIDWLSNLRLRASYGVNGTLPSDYYGHLSLTSYTYKYMGNPGGALVQIANPDLAWETNYTYNLALEFGLFKNRVNGTIEYFNRDSKNLLQDVPISTTTGMGSTLSNIGEMNNRGWEIELNGDIVKTRDFSWNMGITASAIQSKITKLYGGNDIILTSGRGRFILREGYSPLSLYGYEWAGVYEDERGFGVSAWYLNNNGTAEATINGRPASYGRESYERADEIIIGKIDPDLFGGISSNFRWKNLSLDLGFIYKLGGKTYDREAGKEAVGDGYFWERTHSRSEYYDRWSPENKNGKYPQMIGDDFEDVNEHSSRHMHDATFLRLKNLTLAYTLPKVLIQKTVISNARVYFNSGNLWTWAAYKQYDPEVGADGTRGWEMPIGKTFTFGIELSF